MSRVAKAPVLIPTGVEITLNGQNIDIQGQNGKLSHTIHIGVQVYHVNNQLIFSPRKEQSNGWALAGTTRSLLHAMVIGVTEGFSKKIHLVGVGYRASIKNNIINLSLGFSHLIDHQLPVGISAECPTQTEIVIKGANKQMVGQVAADIRAYRRPDPYKGKGIRYEDEIVHIKEAKKK